MRVEGSYIFYRLRLSLDQMPMGFVFLYNERNELDQLANIKNGLMASISGDELN